MQEFEKLKSINTLESVYVSLIRRTELCMRQQREREGIFNNICDTTKNESAKT